MANGKTFQTYEIEEINPSNLLFEENYGVVSKQWLGGLSTARVGSNASITLTDTGYRIYRSPNQTGTPGSGSGQTQNWIGLHIVNGQNNRYGFVQGHSYMIAFDVKGVSDTAASDVSWSNQQGWGGGGLTPSPSSVVKNNPVTSSFNTSEWQHFSYKWTINDSVYKTCTQSYSGFTEGNTYMSYNGFKFGWGYTQTGSLGTDVYIKNLRMYDITNISNPLQIGKNETQCLEIIEGIEPVQFNSVGGIECNELIEI